MAFSSNVFGRVMRVLSDRARRAQPAHVSHSAAGASVAPALPEATASRLSGFEDDRRLPGAVGAMQRAVAKQPRNAPLLNDLGCMYLRLGSIDEALTTLQHAVRLDPHSLPMWMNLGQAYMVAREWDAAAEAFRRALVLDDRSAAAWSALGVALSECGLDGDAEAACREAIVLGGAKDSNYLVDLAGVLAAQGRGAEARQLLQQRLANEESWTAGWRRLALLHASEGDLSAAEACYRKAMGAGPADAAIAVDLAHVLLARGDYSEGFRLFENRFAASPSWFTPEIREAAGISSGSAWSHGELVGKHVLVLGEQGFGDQLMMLRYLPLLKRLGASRVSLACAEELRSLAAHVVGVDAAMSLKSSERPADADIRVPMLTLPFLTQTTFDSVPDARCIDPASFARRDTAVDGLPGLKVGLAWAGHSTAEDRLRRGFLLRTLEPMLSVPDVSFVSLQKGPRAVECTETPFAGRILDVMSGCHDFLDTARLVTQLDLVISVDTAVAHLAGVLGVPVWLILKPSGEWRWGATSSTTPWYPGMQIFRQRDGEPWSTVSGEISAALGPEAVRKRQEDGGSL